MGNMVDATFSTVAAVIGMIPEGLVLLTSSVMAVSVIRLSKYKVLVQQLYCIEILARVNVICLDKTGTITEGKMDVVDVIPYKNRLSFSRHNWHSVQPVPHYSTLHSRKCKLHTRRCRTYNGISLCV